ncbi:MAG TPA: transcription termination factor NusA [Dictyoglomaceae bacterium]|nr:transcription termination factor NusA [Dictyoglomaceae bacterium]HPU42945.1 transcription termination factor NusA [Dictyoglomaceae bacterium]
MKLGEDFWVVLEQIIKEKKLDKSVVIEALRKAILSAFRKTYGTDKSARVEIDFNKQEIRIYVVKKVAEKISEPMDEITLEEAKILKPDIEIGDEIEIEIEPQEFGRIAVQVAKQVIMQSLKEAERKILYEKYKAKEGELVNGNVVRIERGNVYVRFPDIEAVLPLKEQIPGEEYWIGRRLRTYLLEVRKTTRDPLVILSRSHTGFLKRLFELEVPEIKEGSVEIVSIAREPGVRSKVAVLSHYPEIDPVGSCVGYKGVRIQNIINEVNGEKIDIILWSKNPAEFVARSLSPAKPTFVELKEDEKRAIVVVPPDQFSLAIGKDGQNVRLAVKLTSWRIDVRTPEEYEKEKVNEKETEVIKKSE